jgi:hypothetical protein
MESKATRGSNPPATNFFLGLQAVGNSTKGAKRGASTALFHFATLNAGRSTISRPCRAARHRYHINLSDGAACSRHPTIHSCRMQRDSRSVSTNEIGRTTEIQILGQGGHPARGAASRLNSLVDQGDCFGFVRSH